MHYTIAAQGGCSAVDATATVTIYAAPTASPTPSPASVCIGSTVNINGTPSGGSGTYTTHAWTVQNAGGTGASGSNLTNAGAQTVTFSATGLTAGTVTLRYTVTDNNGCPGTADVTVTVNAVPTVTCPSNLTVCTNTATFALTGGSPGGGAYSGTGVSGGNFNPATAGLGTHTITYTYTSGGCTNTCMYTITVVNPPSVTCPSDMTVCAEILPLTLSGGTPFGGTYSGPYVSGGLVNPPPPLVQSFFDVFYSVTDPMTNCSNTCTFRITVNPSPAAVNASGAGTFCGSTTITASNGGSGTIYFQGTTSGGTSTATASTSEVVTVSGTYYFRARSADGCWGPQGSVTVTINPLPTAGTCNKVNDLCQTNTGKIDIQASGGTPPYSVTWTPAHGTPSQPAAIATSGGILTVMGLQGGVSYLFVVKDANNCQAP